MKLKPVNCHSFSICSGPAKNIEFFIGQKRVPSIKDEEQKFLGKALFFSGKSEDTYILIRDILKESLDNDEASLVRVEYKLWILKNYLLPSKRFLLTVHTLPVSHLKKLDKQVDKYTKKWAGVPRNATNAVIHSKEGLDIPTISAIYTEAHNSSHTRTRLQGDMVCNLVLNHTLVREAEYSLMHCTTTEAEKV